jgi:flagellar FliL protein
MADIPTLGAADAQSAPSPPRSLPWLWLSIAALVLLGAGGAGVWLLLDHGAKPAAAAAHHATASPSGPALYVALDPPFVTNFEAEQLVRFLQVTVQVMTHDPATAELVKVNDPVIRNDLLLLFSNQKYADIATRAGKERLRDAALGAVRRVVAAAGGAGERVDAVYFTSFVMQ